MLDAYIIERIRRERESERDTGHVPLRIHVPDSPANPGRRRPQGRQPETHDETEDETDRGYGRLPDDRERGHERDTEDETDRGSIIIDFSL
jgi:hypothetical protein